MGGYHCTARTGSGIHGWGGWDGVGWELFMGVLLLVELNRSKMVEVCVLALALSLSRARVTGAGVFLSFYRV